MTALNYPRDPIKDVPELNLPLLLEVLRDYEANPSSFDYDWRSCFAGQTVIRAGGRWLVYKYALLYPTGDDDPDARESFLTDGQQKVVTVGDRAQRLLGLTTAEANGLFIQAEPRSSSEHTYREAIVKILRDRDIDPSVIDRP